MTQNASPAGTPVPIPKIIHQIWYQGEENVPPRYRAFREGWMARHPGWRFQFWDEPSMRALIDTRYPWFLAQYDRYPRDINRIDAIRYFILDHHGGVYLDLDMENLKPIDELTAGHDLLLSETVVYNTAVMASTAGHPLWPEIHAELRHRRDGPGGLKRFYGIAYKVAFTAGPLLFTDVVRRVGAAAWPGTRNCPYWLFEPGSPALIDGHLVKDDDTSRSYAIHHMGNGWLTPAHAWLSRWSKGLFDLFWRLKTGGRRPARRR
jgi:Mannosyltransferase OCH1 and related enzymes